MQMDAGLDTGDTIVVRDLKISSQETSSSLHDRLAVLGAELMVNTLNTLDQGALITRTPQPTEGITYAEKILKNEAGVDWRLSATEIDRRIRAFNPFPGSTSRLNGELLKFWNSCLPSKEQIYPTQSSGQVLGFSEDGVYVQCGEGVIEILEMQKPGEKKTSASACLKTYRLQEKIMQFKKD
jgi:methionyl-tRNA formyltransferase